MKRKREKELVKITKGIEGSAHQRYCPFWVAIFETCSNRTGLLPHRAFCGGRSTRNLCSSGTLLPSAKAYKAWVGRIFLRCGSKSQKLLMLLVKNKIVWVLRPQSRQTVVVVHPCLQLRFIRHECCTSFFDVGASLKNCSCHLKRIKPCESFGPKADKQIVGRSSLTDR